jgi:hypothetical protein
MKLSRMLILFLISLSLLLSISGCSDDTSEVTNENVDKENPIETMESESEDSKEIIESEEVEVDQPVEWIEYTNEEKSFTLLYPSNWLIVNEKSYGVVLRPTSDTQTTLYVDARTTEYADYTYDDFVDEMITDLKRIKSEGVFSDLVTMQINEYPFVNMDYTITNDYGNWMFRIFYSANNNLGYQIYYGALDTEYDLYQPIMEEIALSFKFLQ